MHAHKISLNLNNKYFSYKKTILVNNTNGEEYGKERISEVNRKI